ncbi:lysosomal proton-coupled steroid conjugate and bile acid symporter SLC46A3-like isoform X2 [Plodia interpunctella]|uniref:lysosomal proton-coupled steroid conjugate and bile acid symporter SLC46A3-like isoform X2 n=1 Tax=Plodia interpunctella TaxID=58824 RepID=UPI002367F26A|nr:solute carrier family 46 member 3-like isoform X3 [Plodia interpunctella]
MELTNRNTNESAPDFTEEDPLRENGEAKKKISFGEHLMYIFRNVTVEPSVTLFIIPVMISSLVSQNLALEKACRVNLQFPEEICNLLKNQSLQSQNQYEKETQRLVSSAIGVKTYMTATIPCVLALFAGSYSDKHDGKGVCHFFRTFFDFSNIKNTMHVIVKKTPDNRRLRLCILLLVVTILFGPMYGEISIMYMSTRYRFNWDEVKYSIFQTYNFITHTIGTIFSISVFSKYLQWHDSILGIISTLSKIAGSFVYCFAPNEKIFFIAPIVEILNGTSLLAMRSIVSKLVDPDELGKVNSLFGLTENLMPLLYVPLYTQVYTATMETLPGFVFLMGALMTTPAVIVFFWLLYEHRKNVRKMKALKTPMD